MARPGSTGFGSAARDYATFRAGFPDSIFDRLGEFGVGQAGQVVIDLGTGTGTLARGFAQRSCRVTGVDPDSRMTEQARKLDAAAGVSVTYVEATAEQTGLATAVADVVTAGQCWHWFDRPAAALECVRLLKPGGKLVIAHFDWLPLSGNLVAATEALILRYNPDWHLGGGTGLYPQWFADLSAAGFEKLPSFSYDLNVPYSPVAWCGRIRASAGVTVLQANQIRRFDRDLASMLSSEFPGDMLAVPHRVFAIVAELPAACATLPAS